MEDRIRNLLKPNEHLRWSGSPGRDPFFNAGNRSRLIVRWVIMAVVAVGLTAAYALYCARAHIAYYWAVNIFTLGVPLYVSILPFMDYLRLRKVVYAITEQRVLVSANPNRSLEMRLSDVDRIELSPCAGGSTLILGSPVAGIAEHKLRVLSLYGKTDEVGGKERVIGLALYNLADADLARSVLIEGPIDPMGEEAPQVDAPSSLAI